MGEQEHNGPSGAAVGVGSEVVAPSMTMASPRRRKNAAAAAVVVDEIFIIIYGFFGGELIGMIVDVPSLLHRTPLVNPIH